MSGAIRTGGPAYPEARSEHNPAFPSSPFTRYTPGMTLRDYFAARALPTFLDLANTQIWNAAVGHPGPVDNAHIAATAAYIVADAMLRAREGAAS